MKKNGSFVSIKSIQWHRACFIIVLTYCTLKSLLIVIKLFFSSYIYVQSDLEEPLPSRVLQENSAESETLTTKLSKKS